MEELFGDRADASEVVRHRVLLDLAGGQVAADGFALQEVLQEHPQQHPLLATLPALPHEESPHARHSYVVAVVYSCFPQPLGELLDGDGRGKFVPDLFESLWVIFDLELQPPKEHPQQVGVGIAALLLLPEICAPVQLLTRWHNSLCQSGLLF